MELQLRHFPTADELREHLLMEKMHNQNLSDQIQINYAHFIIDHILDCMTYRYGVIHERYFTLKLKNDKHLLTDDEHNELYKFFFDRQYAIDITKTETTQNITIRW